jgi:ankyrin repeat protein
MVRNLNLIDNKENKEQGEQSQMFDRDGLTPLMHAVYNKDKTEVEKILRERPDIINFVNSNTGTSALWMASAQGHIETIKILLAAGADLTNKNKEGLTPADVAGKMGHKSAAEIILSYVSKTIE